MMEVKGVCVFVCLLQLISPHSCEKDFSSCGLQLPPDSKLIIGPAHDLQNNPAGDWPWMASLGYYEGDKWTHNCGATLVDEKHLLTAAHCFMESSNRIKVRMGMSDLNSEKERNRSLPLDILNVAVHPKYHETQTAYFDVAIATIEKINFTKKIRPICLPSESSTNQDQYQHFLLTVTGWGSTSVTSAASDTLKRAEVIGYSQAHCNRTHEAVSSISQYQINIAEDLPNYFQSQVLCAGNSVGREGPCKGDSGGPLFYEDTDIQRFVQVGVTQGSIGECGVKITPSIYVRVNDPDIFHFINSTLSEASQGPQIVKGKDYSNPKSPQFYCGRGKYTTAYASIHRARNQVMEERFSDSPICGATIINDRCVVTAAYCVDPRERSLDDGVYSINLRNDSIYKEAIEFKNTFIHPEFEFRKGYHDIAIVELAKRIEYDYDKYGDSPACLAPEDLQTDGLTAYLQGYGFTEHGTFTDKQLESDVILMNNVECNQWFYSNFSSLRDDSLKYKNKYHRNITDGLICSRGIFDQKTGIYSGPCQGYSGGPLYLNRGTGDLRQQTLIGIISAGFSCGNRNVPAINTRVSAYRPWIDCIINGVEQNLGKTEIETKCYEFANST